MLAVRPFAVVAEAVAAADQQLRVGQLDKLLPHLVVKIVHKSFPCNSKPKQQILTRSSLNTQ